ncbi:hypothetical protein EJB05_01107, partial [Eragrostis curvula]
MPRYTRSSPKVWQLRQRPHPPMLRGVHHLGRSQGVRVPRGRPLSRQVRRHRPGMLKKQRLYDFLYY